VVSVVFDIKALLLAFLSIFSATTSAKFWIWHASAWDLDPGFFFDCFLLLEEGATPRMSHFLSRRGYGTMLNSFRDDLCFLFFSSLLQALQYTNDVENIPCLFVKRAFPS